MKKNYEKRMLIWRVQFPFKVVRNPGYRFMLLLTTRCVHWFVNSFYIRNLTKGLKVSLKKVSLKKVSYEFLDL